MTEISKILTEVANRQDLSVSFNPPKQITNLSTEEQQILEVKYKSKPFGKLGASEFQIACKQMIIRLSVITGWSLPQSEEVEDMLIDEFKRKILESYPTMNLHEFMWAIRNCSSRINNWGKELNISLIDQILQVYLEKRLEVSKIEESKNVQPKMIENKEDISDDGMQKFLDMTRDNNVSAEFISPQMYPWLIKMGKINPTREQKWDFVKKAIHKHINNLHDDIAVKSTMERQFELEQFKDMLESRVLKAKYIPMITSLSEKMIVHDYIHKKQTI